MSIQGLATTE